MLLWLKLINHSQLPPAFAMLDISESAALHHDVIHDEWQYKILNDILVFTLLLFYFFSSSCHNHIAIMEIMQNINVITICCATFLLRL